MDGTLARYLSLSPLLPTLPLRSSSFTPINSSRPLVRISYHRLSFFVPRFAFADKDETKRIVLLVSSVFVSSLSMLSYHVDNMIDNNYDKVVRFLLIGN